MKQAVWNRILIVLWAVALALLTVFVLGFTHFFSFFFEEKHLLLVVNTAFPLLSVIYSILLWRFARPVRSRPLRIVALLVPCLLLWLLLF